MYSQLLVPCFITICSSLVVHGSAPPPGGTYTNEDTASNEHPPPPVLNYRAAVPLPRPATHPEILLKLQLKLKHNKHFCPQELKRETHVHVCCSAAPCLEGVAGRLRACLCGENWVFVHYTVSCAII